jgi:membrane protease YdiL (CAAX protease family)
MFKYRIENIHLDWKIAILTITSTLVLMVDYYHSTLIPWSKWFSVWEKTGISTKVLDRTLLYFLIPIAIILVVFRENPKDYGFTLGNWKIGIIFTLGAIILITPILLLIGRSNPSIVNYYQPGVSGMPWGILLDLFGWEFLFRGWLLFGYARKFGTDALWIQAVPFALAHIGKPELETLSTIFGGFAFGWVAWQSKSFVYPLIIHWYVTSCIIVIVADVVG